MDWWEDEDRLEGFETPECFGDEGIDTCERCVLVTRVVLTLMKLGFDNVDCPEIFSYWMTRIQARYGMPGVYDAMIKFGMVFSGRGLEASLFDVCMN